ncbi:hypothetical protein GCM10009560_74840 [Nonomuraea longicatena]|uniref:Tyr recombinase domain-containing protein n=1 Tax=Nonomuraea longicatena TaxID=83682 RepID=A0ABN1R7I9_9ACTN
MVGIPQAIIPALREHLEVYVKPETTALVFAGVKGSPMRRSGFKRLAGWAGAVAGIGAPNLHLRDLRHAGNMIAATSGAGLKDLMTRMGHDNVRAATIYQHAVRGADKLITEAIDKHLVGHERARDDDEDGPPWGARSRGMITRANGTLMARGDQRVNTRSKPRLRVHRTTWAFARRAGDGNRTRAVSLGS